jgi:phosphate uptake regulator
MDGFIIHQAEYVGMETRKVQVTGGSTYTVSIPKEWATENGIDAGSTVAFHPDGDTLVLTRETDEGHTEGELDVSSLEGDDLVRAVMTMYVSGFDVITLSADRITTDQRRFIRDATANIVGLEVLEETSDRVVLQDLLDSSELSIHNAITRMRLIATSMLKDAVTALVENDADFAHDVIERDSDVDRLWYLVSRIFRATLRSPTAAEELGLPRETCFDYHSSARQLERIADHAAKIAQVSLDLGAVSPEVGTALRELHGEAATVIEDAMDALLEDDPDDATRLANDARNSILDIDEYTRNVDELLHDLEPEDAQNLGLVVDSLSRSADYGGNIAETALQKAAPRP